jgi:hypothetical protein
MVKGVRYTEGKGINFGDTDNAAAADSDDTRRSFMKRFAAGAAGLIGIAATTEEANAQVGTFTPSDWSNASDTRNIASFNQQVRFNYYTDDIWKGDYTNDPNVKQPPFPLNFTLNTIPNSASTNFLGRTENGLFGAGQKKVIELQNRSVGLSKTIIQPFPVGFGQIAPKEVEYVLSNAPNTAGYTPEGIEEKIKKGESPLVRPGSAANGIIVIPEEAVKKENVGMTFSRKDKDMIITLTTFGGTNGREPVQITRYVLKDQLDQTKHPAATKIYIASKGKLIEPMQKNADYRKNTLGEPIETPEFPGLQFMNQYTLFADERTVDAAGKKVTLDPFFFQEDLASRKLGMDEGSMRHVQLLDRQGNPEKIPSGPAAGQDLFREVDSYNLEHLRRVGPNFKEASTTYGTYNPDRSRENEFAQEASARGGNVRG